MLGLSRSGARLRAGVIASIASGAVACSLSLGGTGAPEDDAGEDGSTQADAVAPDTTLPPADATLDVAAGPDATDAPAETATDARKDDAAKDSATPDAGADAGRDATTDGDAGCVVACPCTTEVTCPRADDVCLGLVCVRCGAAGSQNLLCHGGGKCHEVQAVCM